MSEYIVSVEKKEDAEAIERTYACEELIRCKDCLWYEIYELKKDGTDDHRYNPSFCERYSRLHDPDWFCADGMRKKRVND